MTSQAKDAKLIIHFLRRFAQLKTVIFYFIFIFLGLSMLSEQRLRYILA